MERHVPESNRSAAALDTLLHVFETTLADVPFPDVSATALREASDLVLDKADAVAEAETALAAARAAQDEARKSFEKLGRRALAYAQVYADGDEALTAKLGEVARDLAGHPRAAEQAVDAPKKRGRPKKVDTSLFEQGGGVPAEAEEEAAQ